MKTALYFQLHDVLFMMAMVSARVMPTFILLPFLNNSTLTGAIRMPVALIVGAALWPYDNYQIPEWESIYFAGLVLKELLIGAMLAFFLALPFWFLHAVGCIIDNQRGALLSSSIDPLSGMDTTELANFFNIFAAVVVLQSGGLLRLLEVFERSYQLWFPFDFTFPPMAPMLTFLTLLVANALILASPLVAAFLLTELFLGVLARFAPQLNAFALALTVKSAVAFLLLILYFSPIFPDKTVSMQFLAPALNGWSVSNGF